MTTVFRTRTLESILGGLFDDEAIRPPASIDLADALEGHLRHKGEPEGEMLDRLVVAAADLERLTELLDETPEDRVPDEGLRLSVIAGLGRSAAEAREALRTDVPSLMVMQDAHGARVDIDAVETRLPVDLAARADASAILSHLVELSRVLQSPVMGTSMQRSPALWIETGVDGERPDVTEALVEAVAGLRQGPVGTPPMEAGIELGLDRRAERDPPPAQLARLLAGCESRGVPLRLCAGRHRPVYEPAEGSGAPRHGYLNVLAAAVLARANDLDAGAMVEVLTESDPGAITVDDGLAYGELRATADDVRAARAELFTSLGTGSFERQCEELRAMGWLEARGGAG